MRIVITASGSRGDVQPAWGCEGRATMSPWRPGRLSGVPSRAAASRSTQSPDRTRRLLGEKISAEDGIQKAIQAFELHTREDR